jgi:hypothetical protein
MRKNVQRTWIQQLKLMRIRIQNPNYYAGFVRELFCFPDELRVFAESDLEEVKFQPELENRLR